MGAVPNTDLEKYAKEDLDKAGEAAGVGKWTPDEEKQGTVPQKTLDKESWNEENRPEPADPQPSKKEE